MTTKQIQLIETLATSMKMPTTNLPETKKLWRDGYNTGLKNLVDRLKAVAETEKLVKKLNKE